LKIYEGAFGPDSPNLAVTLLNLSEVLRLSSKTAEATITAKRAASILVKARLDKDRQERWL
jgi:hypothetical protein